MKYLVCIDSDGCAIDSMNIKHFECFGPAFVEVWEIERNREKILSRWNEINLYTGTRGINRFKGLGIILGETAKGDAIKTFITWTEQSPELSNQALEEYIRKTDDEICKMALKWSHLVNEKIEKLPVARSFPFVKETMTAVKEKADIAVISSANKEAIMKEWEAGGLLELVDYVFSQNEGTKSQCIRKLLEQGYENSKVLMVGDAPGDSQAAKENQVWFYPILAGKEAESWKNLKKQWIEKFLSGQFDEDDQKFLREQMRENLSGNTGVTEQGNIE